MAKSKSRKSLHFSSYSDLIDFFDQNDLGEYLKTAPEAHFSVKLRGRLHMFALDPELVKSIEHLAKSKKTSSEKLINSWVREKIKKRSA